MIIFNIPNLFVYSKELSILFTTIYSIEHYSFICTVIMIPIIVMLYQ